MSTVYLCGGINGLTDAECKAWRDEAKAYLTGHTVRDPMDRDYRGKESENVAQIVLGDMDDIRMSDILLVNASRPSWGTAMEIRLAREWHKHVIAFGAGERPSPWLAFHALLVPTLVDALEKIAP